MDNFYEEYGKKRSAFRAGLPLGNKKRLDDINIFFKSPTLDVGCSKGYDVNYFRKQGFIVDSCDISFSVIKTAKKIYGGTFFTHNFEKKKLNKKYNTIFLFDVIEHVFDTNSFLTNINNSLNVGGYLILTTPNVCGLKNRLSFIFGNGGLFIQEKYSEPHIRFFTPKTLEMKLNESGFEVINVFGYSSISFLPPSLCGSLTVVSKKNN